jgi:hypothetical protein
MPRDANMLATRISTRCIQGRCGESDFWQDGSEGPGFYHRIGGENEKLDPGRIN